MIFKVKDRVKALLSQIPTLRDNDQSLIAWVWRGELQEAGLSSENIDLILSVIAKGKITPAETITRCRRKIQELHPELRGSEYVSRKQRQEPVKTELKEWHKKEMRNKKHFPPSNGQMSIV